MNDKDNPVKKNIFKIVMLATKNYLFQELKNTQIFR
jgi:hypothetical protein